MKEFYVSVAIVFCIRVAGALGAFLLTVVLARTLGLEQSGYYFLAFSIVAILAAFSRIGLDNTLVRLIGADNSQARAVLKKALVMTGTASLLCSTFVFVFTEPLALHVFGKPELASVLKSISLGIFGLAILTIIGCTLQGMGKIISSVLVTGIILNFSLIAALLIIQPVTAASFARFYAQLSVATALIGCFFFLRHTLAFADTEIEFRQILKSCLPLWIVVIMQQLVQWSGLIIAGVYLEPESIARIASAQRTAMLVSFILVAVNLVVAPRFALLFKQGQLHELEKLSLNTVRLVTILALPVILVIVSFPEKIMGLFGSEFVSGGPLLRVFAIGQFINAITGSVGLLLIMSGYERDVRNITLISGGCSLLLAWVLTVYFGETGNALGTAISVAGQNLLAVYFVRKRLGFNTLGFLRQDMDYRR